MEKNIYKQISEERWNKNLISYRKQIEDGTFKEEQIEDFLSDVFVNKSFFEPFDHKDNYDKLREVLPKLRPALAKYFKCSEDEIYIGDIYNPIKEELDFPYVAVLGNLNGRELKSADKLKFIGGNADFSKSEFKSLNSLTTIGGDADFSKSRIEDLSYLKIIGGNADFKSSSIKNLGSLLLIGGNADFRFSHINNLSSLKTIYGDADFYESTVDNLSSLTTIERNADFRFSYIDNLSSLTTIYGDANFFGSKINGKNSLTTIGGDANFDESQFEDLSSLTSIGSYLAINEKQLLSLKKLNNVGSKIYLGPYEFFYNAKNNIPLEECLKQKTEEIKLLKERAKLSKVLSGKQIQERKNKGLQEAKQKNQAKQTRQFIQKIFSEKTGHTNNDGDRKL